ncbi:MAG: L-rhamnose mutarotase [Christensenellaceae bacterium]|nr:L-rhamnose mutarotase [Christensenellaceae bacterium]
MRRRFCQRAFLKPNRIDEYRQLHASVWAEVLDTIADCNLENYSIYILGNMVISYFEYTGDDYQGDMRKMEADPVTQRWWAHTKPCFLHHDRGIYYEDLVEIFYQA